MNDCFRLLTWLLLIAAIPVTADTIRLRADYWYPFNGQPDNENPGYMIELAKYAWEPHGHIIDYQITSWENSIEQTRRGDSDCIVGAFKSDAPDFIYPNKSLGLSTSAFYALKGHTDWQYNGLNSLSDIRLGIIDSYSYGEVFDSYLVQHNKDKNIIIAQGNKPLENLIQLAQQGEVDVILESPVVFQAKILKENLATAFEERGRLNDLDYVYIACSPENRNSSLYVELLDRQIMMMRKSGFLSTLLAKYGLEDWETKKPSFDYQPNNQEEIKSSKNTSVQSAKKKAAE